MRTQKHSRIATTRHLRKEQAQRQPARNAAKNSSVEVASENSILDLIAQQPLFAGLNTSHLQLMTQSAMIMNYEVGQQLFKQGDPANRFYLILEGRVAIETETKEHVTVTLQKFGPGADLGWSWLVPPHYLHFSALAIEPTKAIFFYGTRLRQQCEDNSEFGYELMKRVATLAVQNLESIHKNLMECAGAKAR
jgi:CRP/FNR family transcriptional regulator, cyclic AMP receptor protein